MQLNRLKTEFINISTLSASPLKIGDSLSILHQSVDKNRFVSPSIRQPDTTAFIILIRRCTGCFNFIYWDNNCKVSLGLTIIINQCVLVHRAIIISLLLYFKPLTW